MRTSTPTLTTLTVALFSVACSPPTYVRVETGAQAIEQPTPGQGLLAAAPIPSKGYGARLVMGAGARITPSSATGPNGEQLLSGRSFVGGALAINVRGVELGFIGRSGVNRHAEAPREGASWQGGMRMRWTLGGDRLFFNLAVEGGLRRINVSLGRSLLCDVVPNGQGAWAPAPGGTCWFSDERRGVTDRHIVSYAAATLAPTIRLSERVHIFGGVSVDTLATQYVRDEVWTLYDGVPAYQSCESSRFEHELVGTWIAGLDLRTSGPFGLLINVRGGGVFGPDVGPPSAEAALNMVF